MIEYIKRAIIIVNRGNVIAANAIAKQIDTVGGEFTWTAKLSPSGNEPATHFWCNWQMTEDERATLGDLLDEIPGQSEQIFDLSDYDPLIAEPTPEEVLATMVPPLKVIGLDII